MVPPGACGSMMGGSQVPASPRLSVVLPVYGVERYLTGCLDSVLAHPGDDIEVIAVDDASPDGCGRILAARAGLDQRLRVVHLERNGGPGNARNIGLELAAGDYVWFIDGDDMTLDGATGAIVERLSREPPDVLLIDYEYLTPDGRTQPSYGQALLRGAPPGSFTLAQQPQLINLTMTSWSKVIRRAFLVGLGVPFPPGIHEDVPVSCAVMLEAGRIATLDRACYRYRWARPGSFMVTTSSANFAIFDAYRQVFDFLSKRDAAAGTATTAEVSAALFERAIWHYSTVLQAGGIGIGPIGRGGLVPRSLRRQFFTRMHEDFVRYVPAGYRHPPGARGAKFRLVERNAYWAYELLEPPNRARVALHRLASRQPR
jgi:CDP-glycerol glycerophosphotransferase